jgi:hypothetical protein
VVLFGAVRSTDEVPEERAEKHIGGDPFVVPFEPCVPDGAAEK